MPPVQLTDGTWRVPMVTFDPSNRLYDTVFFHKAQ